MRNSILTLVVFLFATNLFSQEICNNGIDDDGNGMIDLNDTACTCNGLANGGTPITSLIPNPSFEQYTACPTQFSQVNYCTGWIQATNATSDYYNTCGFTLPALQSYPALLPFPNGNGIVGTLFLQQWAEYVGACLLQPMIAGQSYTLQFSTASLPITGSGYDCGSGIIYYSPVDITLFGSTSCNNMPVNTFGCPPTPSWYVLGSATYTPVSTWGIISITFTPNVNTSVIILGPPCNLPPSYPVLGNSTCDPYFLFDNLILNTTASFNSMTLNTTGVPCHNNVVLDAHIDTTGGIWQWYRNGIAISGQVDSTLLVSSSNLANGTYTAVYSLGNQCESDDVIINSTIPAVTIPNVTNVSCFGQSNGSATANVLGANGNINFIWNSNPVQQSATAINLDSGIYIVTITDSLGCTASDTVTINSPPPLVPVNNPQQICSNASYIIGSSVYVTAGTYSDTLQSTAGCDSVVITQLTVSPDYAINNPQLICNGGSYTVGGHTYYAQGNYFDTLSTFSGCDSIIITQITTGQSQTFNNSTMICAGDSIIIGIHTYSSTGTYTDSLLSTTGCDSILITNLYVNLSLNVNLQTICAGDSYSLNSNSYTISGVYFDSLQTVVGCDSVIQTILTVNPLPQLVITPLEVCVNSSPLALNLVVPAGGIYSGNNVLNNFFIPDQPGVHSIQYRYTNPVTNCSNNATGLIHVWPLPEVDFILSPKITTLSYPLINFLDKSLGGMIRKWEFGDGTFSGDMNGTHVYSDTGYYEVSLELIDVHGCRSTGIDQVYVGPEFSFYVPNAFTPNGDGMNDEFNGKGVSITKYHLSIFDRWGLEVFNTNSLFKNWDGKNSMADVYVYKINIEDITGKAYEFVGSVTLIK